MMEYIDCVVLWCGVCGSVCVLCVEVLVGCVYVLVGACVCGLVWGEGIIYTYHSLQLRQHKHKYKKPNPTKPVGGSKGLGWCRHGGVGDGQSGLATAVCPFSFLFVACGGRWLLVDLAWIILILLPRFLNPSMFLWVLCLSSYFCSLVWLWSYSLFIVVVIVVCSLFIVVACVFVFCVSWLLLRVSACCS